MKNILSVVAVSTLILLTACNHSQNWDHDCNSHYSVNDRELARCKERLKDNAVAIPATDAVTVDSINTQAPTLERLGKAHDNK